MKKSVWIIGIVTLVTSGFLAATPFIAISNIKTAIVEKDSRRLSENIDFPVFRQNVKNRVKSSLMKYIPAEAQLNPLAAIAAGFGEKMVDGLVDSLVTPGGLATLMKGERPPMTRSRGMGFSNTHQANRDELFKNARYSYDSLDRFSIWVPTETRGGIRFILQRDGLSWKLVDMVVPI